MDHLKGAELNRKLNLVIPIDRDDGAKVFVHAQPLPYEIYRPYLRPLARLFNDIQYKGFWGVGPRVASEFLYDIAAEMDMKDSVANGLMPEIYRLTNVLLPNEKENGRWVTLPFSEVQRKGLLLKEHLDEIEGLLLFFTAGWHIHRRDSREKMLAVPLMMWGALTTYSGCTEFHASLQTSTPDGNTGATPKV
jgi:hypothetical protein